MFFSHGWIAKKIILKTFNPDAFFQMVVRDQREACSVQLFPPLPNLFAPPSVYE
jgi:hypothetical protein